MNNKAMLTLFLFAVLLGCKKEPTSSNNQTGSFSIVLLKNDTVTTSQAKQNPLESLIVDEQPIITINDIIAYHWSEHSIELTKDGSDRVDSLESKVRSTYGLPFIVMVGGEKIYLGNIYPYYSSLIYPDIPYFGVAPFISLKIERAPNPNIEDKRIDQRIYTALEISGKLR